MKWTMAAVLCIAFAMRTPGQAQDVPNVPVAVTWNYYPQPKTLFVHLTNNSGKDITAYNISVRNKYADGTQDDQCCGLQSSSEFLGGLIAAQMAKGTPSEQFADRANNIFAAGTTRDQTILETKDISSVDAIVDVAVYADGTKDVENENALKRIWAGRQRELLAMQKINRIVQDALADQTNEHPTVAALTELTAHTVQLAKYTVEMRGREESMNDIQQGQEAYLDNGIQTLRNMQQPRGKTTERERLTKYAESLEKRIGLMSPHCALVTITLFQ